MNFKINIDFKKLVGGTLLSQLILVLFSPLITRLYLPEEYGVYSLILAYSSILAIISSGRLEFAISIPSDLTEAKNIVRVAYLVILVVFILAISVIYFDNNYADIIPNISGLLGYFIPIFAALISFMNLQYYYRLRLADINRVSSSNVLKSLGLVVGQALLNFSKIGLILGQITSYFLTSWYLTKVNFERLKAREIRKTLRRYKRFWYLLTPAQVLNSLSANALTLIIGSNYGLSALGAYALGQKIVGLPMSVLGTSLSQLLLSRLGGDELNRDEKSREVKRTLTQGLVLSGVCFTLIFSLIDFAIPLVFGSEWVETAFFVKALIPVMAIKFVSSTISIVSVVYEKQQIDLVINIVQVIALLIITMIDLTLVQMLSIYNIAFGLIYLVSIRFYLRIVR